MTQLAIAGSYDLKREWGWLVTAALAATALVFCGSRLIVEGRLSYKLSQLRAGHQEAALAGPGFGGDQPRDRVYRAAARLTVASRMEEGAPERSAMLTSAQADMRKALEQRPGWGEAWVVAANLAELADGSGSQRARAAFSESYRRAPFLRSVGEWRIRYGVAHWDSLTPEQQASVEWETILMARLSRKSALHMRVLTEYTPLYERYKKRIWPLSLDR
ncbi:MAG: hypothetical protein AB7D33_04385 [Sphingobium sp.]